MFLSLDSSYLSKGLYNLRALGLEIPLLLVFEYNHYITTRQPACYNYTLVLELYVDIPYNI